MRLCHHIAAGVRFGALFAAALGLSAQEPAAPAKDARPKEAPGLPARVSPTEYQTVAKAGSVTIAADFVGHSVPNAQGPLTTEDFVAVELALYGPPEARLVISQADFTLRINGKKTALNCQPYGLVLASLKDPEWVPPESAAPKSKGGITGGGGGDRGGGDEKEPGAPPPVVHIPIEVQRAMAQRTQKAALPLGDRALPQAGVIFFEYHGKTKGINSVELIYSGPAGKATLALQP